jgi:uncharacterized protein (DUF736 family)
MAEYDDSNRFVLFKQDKGDNANRPDYTGNINVEGKEYRLAAWIRESKNGVKYLSGTVDKSIDQRLADAPDEPSGLDNAHVEGEEVPF